MTIAFSVPGTPVAKQSYRAVAGGGYQPASVVAWARAVAWCAREVMRGEAPLTEQLIVELDFYMPNRRRVDCDNLAKNVNDALEKGGVFKDDAQIVDLHIRKLFSEPHNARVEIRIEVAT